ncbi:hypothetical protein SPHS6_00566 [Sphingobium sp. S6]|nr:hypothetical protein SPHS6_00566 [Sphingobium sp. S6]CAD7335635.1 hypothetical protein SPHS8_00608 [Sphingobium sp. S8]
MFHRDLRPAAWCWSIYDINCVEPVAVSDLFRHVEAVTDDVQRRASTLFINHALLEHKENMVARVGIQRSIRRGISSTKLQGRKRLSSWLERMPSQASFTAPVEPGSAKI